MTPRTLLDRDVLLRVIDAPAFRRTVLTIIIINAVILGMTTSATLMAMMGPALRLLDQVILALFVIEMALKVFALRLRFLRRGWNVFDFLVIAISLTPGLENFSLLRALRVLRVLRLISVVPKMRLVVSTLLNALPGMGSVIAVLGLIYYIAAVMATHLYGAAFPQWFGHIGRSLYSLFQIMTLESWSMGIVRPVMAQFPYAWVFFVPFIMVTSFAVLNIFIALIVSAMQAIDSQNTANNAAKTEPATLAEPARASHKQPAQESPPLA